jgi:hypothetical protein
MLSAFSVTADLSTCTRCGGMRSVGLDDFRRRVRGRPYRFLLRYHLRHHDRERVRRGLEGSQAMLSPAGRRAALDTAEAWRERLGEGGLADADCAALVDEARERAHSAEDGPVGDDEAFDVFEVATLSLVADLRDDPELRRSVGGLDRGLLARWGWNLVAAAALVWLATAVDGTVWKAAAWAGAGAAVLPPVARAVSDRA